MLTTTESYLNDQNTKVCRALNLEQILVNRIFDFENFATYSHSPVYDPTKLIMLS